MIPNEAGDQMNAYIMKPKTLTQIKISIFMFQYSGKLVLNQVSNSWDGETDFGSIIWCKKDIS